MSIENAAVEAVMDMIDTMGNFCPIRRGALGTGPDLTCEIAPSSVESVFLDKNQYLGLDLTLNGKHPDLKVLSDTLNRICDTLTRRKEYPEGDGWEIVDITRGAPPIPTVIGREENSEWLMAGSVIIKIYRKEDE